MTNEPAQTFLASLRNAVADVADTLDPQYDSQLRAVLDFSERHHCLVSLPGDTASLGPFGDIPIRFAGIKADSEGQDPDAIFWIRLQDLAEPTGCTHEAIHDLWEHDRQAGYHDVDELRFRLEGHDRDHVLQLAGNGFIIRTYDQISPWKTQFFDSFQPALDGAMQTLTEAPQADDKEPTDPMDADGSH